MIHDWSVVTDVLVNERHIKRMYRHHNLRYTEETNEFRSLQFCFILTVIIFPDFETQLPIIKENHCLIHR